MGEASAGREHLLDVAEAPAHDRRE